MARRGLTLVELLVAIGIVSLLLAVTLPSLVSVRNHAQGAVCIQNVRTLALAWLMYKDTNDDALVSGYAGDNPADWVHSPAGRGWGIDSEKDGIRSGALFRFVGKLDVYRCPADLRLPEPGSTVFRSYSIAGGANGEGWKNTYTPVERYSQIFRPSMTYVFVEKAKLGSWSKGSWLFDPQHRVWVDPPAIWHSSVKSCLGYADGHTEMHEWLDPSTIKMSQESGTVPVVPRTEGHDVQFMSTGFPQRVNESLSSGPAS